MIGVLTQPPNWLIWLFTHHPTPFQLDLTAFFCKPDCKLWQSHACPSCCKLGPNSHVICSKWAFSLDVSSSIHARWVCGSSIQNGTVCRKRMQNFGAWAELPWQSGNKHKLALLLLLPPPPPPHHHHHHHLEALATSWFPPSASSAPQPPGVANGRNPVTRRWCDWKRTNQPEIWYLRLTGAYLVRNGWEWGLLGLLFIVIVDHSRKFPTFSTSKMIIFTFIDGEQELSPVFSQQIRTHEAPGFGVPKLHVEREHNLKKLQSAIFRRSQLHILAIQNQMLPASFFWSTPIEDSPVFFFQMVSPSIHNLASWSSPITENSYGAPATTSTPVRACQKLSEWCVRGDDSKNRISSSKHVPFLEPFVYHDEYIGIIMSICLIWYAYRYV